LFSTYIVNGGTSQRVALTSIEPLQKHIRETITSEEKYTRYKPKHVRENLPVHSETPHSETCFLFAYQYMCSELFKNVTKYEP